MNDASPGRGLSRVDLTTFCRLDELGLEVTGQRLDPDRAVLACRVVEPNQWCRCCGCEGVPRDTILRRLAHEPFGWRPTTMHVTVRRYRCNGCGYVWRQDTSPQQVRGVIGRVRPLCVHTAVHTHKESERIRLTQGPMQ